MKPLTSARLFCTSISINSSRGRHCRPWLFWVPTSHQHCTHLETPALTLFFL